MDGSIVSSFQSAVPANLGQGALNIVATLLYLTPVNTRTLVKNINVVNTTISAATFDIYLVPSGGTAGISNAILYHQTVASYTTFQWSGVSIMNAGNAIYALASVAGLAINVGGAECS